MKRLTREWMFNSNQINIINAGIAEKTGKRILETNKLGTNNFVLNSGSAAQTNAAENSVDVYSVCRV
jgi:hypothetical protein